MSCHIWDLATGTIILSLSPEEKGVTFGGISRDGSRIASFSPSRGIVSWDTETGKVVREIPLEHRSIYGMDLSPDGKTIAVHVPGDDIYSLFELSTGKRLSAGKIDGGVLYGSGLSFSNSGKLLASACPSGISIWDAATGKLVQTFEDNNRCAWCLSFSPDDSTLAATGERGIIHLWNVKDGKEIPFVTPQEGKFRRVVFSPDGRCIAMAGHDGVVRLRDLTSRKDVFQLAGSVFSLAYSPDGKKFAGGTSRGDILVWSVIR
jgi:WD40 repeat protein